MKDMGLNIKNKMDVLVDHELKSNMIWLSGIIDTPNFFSFRLTNRNAINNQEKCYIKTKDYIEYVLSKKMLVHESSIILAELYFNF